MAMHVNKGLYYKRLQPLHTDFTTVIGLSAD